MPAPITMPGSGEDATKLFSGNTLQEATLRVVQGSFAGTECALGAGTVVIGRSSECELSLKGAQGVSRRHCKVQYLSDRFVVIDLESRNGTIVNGQSVERKVLEPGDRIEVGDEHILFVVESLDSLRAAPLGDTAIEDAETALVPQAPSGLGAHSRGEHEATDARPAPPADDGDDDGLAETLPPQSAVTDPFRQRRSEAQGPPPPAEPELSSPYQHQAPAPKGSKAPIVFGLLSVVIVVLAVLLIRDIMGGSADSVVDAGSVVGDVAVDAGSADSVVDAGSVEAVLVRASDGGRAASIAVKVGDRVKVGDALMTLTLDNGNLQRKVQALQREEREFAEVAKKVPAAKADLDAVRAELRRAEARLKPKTIKSDQAGTVAEVLVDVGGVVRAGAPVVKLTP